LAEEAKTFPVTRLPYHGPRRHARTQFSKRIRAVTTETRISFGDLDKMHIVRRSQNAEQWVPEFANNDKDLRLVLAQSLWNYILKRGRVPDEFIENLGDLKHLAEAYFHRLANDRTRGQAPRRHLERVGEKMVETIIPCDEQYSNHITHVITVQRAGGYLERDAAVAYHSWRLRHNSRVIGEELGLVPGHVRHILSGLCDTARKLGFDASPPQGDHMRGKVRAYRSNPRIAKLPQAEELVRLVLSGKTFWEIAVRFGVKAEVSVRNAYQRAKRLVIQQMREKGSTWEEIAERFGETENTGKSSLEMERAPKASERLVV
jgi:hypothetical protein